MTDGALSLLLRHLREETQAVLWLVDEHLAGGELPGAAGNVFCLTNRCDTAHLLNAAGYRAALNDFDIAALADTPFEAVLYRVSKEKPVVHHLINESLERLPVGGRLLLAGYKGDGLRTYADKATKLVAGDRTLARGAGGAQLAVIVKRAPPGERLADEDYATLRNIAPPDHPALFSKPGIFGWKKIDRGSATLADCLPAFFEGFSPPPRTVVDLGCGYGYLTVMAHRLLPATYIATDNNAAAVVACERNFREHGIDGKVVLADCGESIAGEVDAVLCNPPFHRGFDVHGQLTERFLKASRRLLKPGGQALYVVNQFIALERKAAGLFDTVDKLAEGGGFKVLRLRV